MEQTVTTRVARSRGYAGKTSDQGWVSEVYGIGKYGTPVGHTVEPDEMDWGESELYRKHKGTWEAVYRLSPGLYKKHPGAGDPDKYLMVWIRDRPGAKGEPTGAIAKIVISEERATEMARLMQEGAPFEAVRIATRKEPPTEIPAGGSA